VGAGGLGIVIVAAMILYWTWPTLDHDGGGHPGVSSAAHAQGTRAPQVAPNPDTVDLSETQLAFVKVALVAEREFPIQKDAIGSIDFNQNMTVQVFTPYPGRIIALFAEVGADVNKGQKLFTIDSPDLLQAESTLIASAGVMDLTSRNLTRLRELYTTRAVSQHDLEQATSDQQTAEGNLRAARDALRLFGKTDADIDHIIATRSADPTLVVPSPISGRVTARNAAPGLFVQPGSGVAPYTVADVNTMWMIANVAEDDSPVFRVGQPEQVRIDAFPGRVFDAKVTTIAAFVDPATRRVVVRSEIKDPQHELRSGMFASFTVGVGAPQRSPAIAVDGVVREGDGAMTIWVTTDRRRFMRRTVKVGRQYQGYWQILDGVKAGELVATEGAVFLSNAFATQSP
jgi:cobalt-zinc-cadmium efflux system membrane fusion protein